MRDLHNNMRTKNVITAAAIGANATKSGIVIDRQGYIGQYVTNHLDSEGKCPYCGTHIARVWR